MTITPPRPTLRDLPVAAKAVVSVFLITVGLGYFSALVQMHLQHSSREGEPLPSPADVVAVFAGMKKYDPTAPMPVSKLEKLVMGPLEGAAWNGSGSMAPAFFHKDGGDYKSETKDDPDAKKRTDHEREGERRAVQAWIRLDDAERKTVYDADRLVWQDTLTPTYRDGDDVKVKTILADRCVRCHGVDGELPGHPLETYGQLVQYMNVREAPNAAGYVRSGRQTSVEKLTQSTHAHLLSFAMLFGLTGILFAFTSYPKMIRLLFAPMVLVAQVADISCWWLARIPDYGVYFAYCILITGSFVGMGLTIHIFGCLLNLYGHKGRRVLYFLFLCGFLGLGTVVVKVLDPALTAQKTAKP